MEQSLVDLRAGQTLWYRMVSPEEADFDQNRISVTSPIGKGLLGKKIGDTVEIAVPAGKLRYEILEITR
jgi:transcription elongation factor GreA